MKGQKCSNCGYYMTGGEALLNNAIHIFKKKKNIKNLLGTNTISHATSMPCPKCEAVNRWIKEDE